MVLSCWSSCAAAAARAARGPPARGWCATGAAGRRAACRRRARWRATSTSRGGWSWTPTRSCSPRAISWRAAGRARTSPRPRRQPTASVAPGAGAAAAFDFFPGAPDLASFPRALWLRALREVLRSAPASAFAYPDARGALELRRALAGLPAARPRRRRRARRRSSSARAPPRGSRCSARALMRAGVARSPSRTRACRRTARCSPTRACEVRGVAVDEARASTSARWTRAAVARRRPRTSARRASCSRPGAARALLAWARAGGLVIEDDYDAEFRYDRAPLGALQGLAPDHVVYLGTVTRRSLPALRLGWLVLPAALLDAVVEAKAARRPRLARRSSSSRSRGCSRAPPTTATCARPPAQPRPPRRARRGRRARAAGRAGERHLGGAARARAAAARGRRAIALLALAARALGRRLPACTQHMIDPPAGDRRARARLREPGRARDRGGHPRGWPRLSPSMLRQETLMTRPLTAIRRRTRARRPPAARDRCRAGGCRRRCPRRGWPPAPRRAARASWPTPPRDRLGGRRSRALQAHAARDLSPRRHAGADAGVGRRGTTASLYVRSERDSGKVKRLRSDPRMLIAPVHRARRAAGRAAARPRGRRARRRRGAARRARARRRATAAGARCSRRRWICMRVDMCYLEITAAGRGAR